MALHWPYLHSKFRITEEEEEVKQHASPFQKRQSKVYLRFFNSLYRQHTQVINFYLNQSTARLLRPCNSSLSLICVFLRSFKRKTAMGQFTVSTATITLPDHWDWKCSWNSPIVFP